MDMLLQLNRTFLLSNLMQPCIFDSSSCFVEWFSFVYSRHNVCLFNSCFNRCASYCFYGVWPCVCLSVCLSVQKLQNYWSIDV